MKGQKEESSWASRLTPIKESDEDIRFRKCFRPSQHLLCELNVIGARGGLVVKALRYKPAGRGFDSR